MRLAHIGIPITQTSDIETFYIGLLDMTLKYQFEMAREMTRRIFGVSRSVPVYMLEKDDVLLELFCLDDASANCFQHVCLWVEDRAELIERAKKPGYKIDIIPRSESEIVFIFDSSGNRFEIKQSAQ